MGRAAIAAPFLILGTVCVVTGVAQVGLGLGQALLASGTPTRRRVAVAVGSWNAGNAAVLVGTLAEMTFLVDVGAAVGLLLARIGPT